MKISKNKFGILQKVSKYSNLYPVKAYPQLQDKLNVHKEFYGNLFKAITSYSLEHKTITYVAENVRKIFDDTPKVAEKLWELRDEVKSQIGILLFHSGTSYFFCIDNNQEDKKVYSSIFTFQNDIFMAFSSMEYVHGSKNGLTYYNTQYCFDTCENEKNYNILFPMQIVTGFLLFISFADHEIKYSDGIEIKKRELNGLIYKNELNIPINIFDSKWFTTFIKSEEFKVSGHFRLQPYGQGLTNRKLIWIEEYIKYGYTRNAKMLQEEG